MLSVDAGSLWTTRRNTVTGTDAAALAAARFFASGQGNPCVPADRTTAEQIALNVLLRNNPRALHDGTITPNGFDIQPELSDAACLAAGATTSFHVGLVRFDGRAPSTSTVGGIFGFHNPLAFSSSTADFGYAVGAKGVRPIGLCNLNANYVAWLNDTPAQYNALFGTDPNRYPSQDKNGTPYLGPNSGGGVVNRIQFTKTNPDGQCGNSPGNWGWLDFNNNNPPNGSQAIKDWILNGYGGTVGINPHDCNPENGTPPNDKCPPDTGAGGSAFDSQLAAIACPPATPSAQCFSFPIVVFDNVTGNGNGAQYDQVAFLTVILRGWDQITGSGSGYFDFEFVDVQVDGVVGGAPNPGYKGPKTIAICSVDNNTSATNHCATPN